MNNADLIITDRDAVRWITLNRPATRNALTLDLVKALGAAFAEAGADSAVRAVVVGGEGAFCSGLDLKAAMMTPPDPAEDIQYFHALIRNLYGIMKPTVAALDGPAAGFGADMALACDLRLSSSRGSLGERFVRIGLMPDGGGTFFLQRLLGTGRAFELLYSGEMVDASTGAQLGLFNRLLPDDGFVESVHAFATTLAKGPPLSYARIKAAVHASMGDLEAALAAERTGQLELVQSEDFSEGVSAFLTRRAPEFVGR